MLSLVEVTPENYEATLALTVAPDQEHLISPVVKSLADAFVWDAEVRAAMSDEVLVGFVMAFPFEIEGEPVVNIVRFMIDHRHQGRGLGRDLLGATLEWLASIDPVPSRVRISTFPENTRALDLYRSAGFEGSDLEHGEVVLWRTLVDREVSPG